MYVQDLGCKTFSQTLYKKSPQQHYATA